MLLNASSESEEMYESGLACADDFGRYAVVSG
jgi:hypothetical protein